LLGDLLFSLQTTLHRVNRLDLSALNQLAQTDLKSVGRVLDKVERLDLDKLSTNAADLLVEVRKSNAKVQTLIDNADGTLAKLPLEKLSKDADALVEQLRETIAKLEPGLASIDFDSLNQTLARARQLMQNIDELINEIKRYPAGFIFGKPPPRLKEVQPGGKQP
jgi:paraquat-inducible protein B